MIAALIWCASAAILFYTLLGYPLALATVLGKRRRPEIKKQLGYKTTVSAIMSVYNGGDFLRKKLDCLLALNYDPSLLQIIVVSDGSTDDTDSIATEYASRGVHLISKRHAGKAAALNAAFQVATGEILFFTDVRQPLDQMALLHLVANFADESVGAVTGEMRLFEGAHGEQAAMGMYWRYELWARKRHSEIDSLFNTTGCIYAMRRALAEPLDESTLSDDAVLPLRSFFKGYRVIFDPEAVAYDYPALPGTEFRRRWRNLAGLWQVHASMPQLFSSKNRMRAHFLPHKFGRLVMPWAAVAMLGATVALPVGWREPLLAVEILPLALCVMDAAVPKDLRVVKRLTSTARTVVLLNIASAAAVSVFFIPAQSLWKPTQVKSSGTSN